jgi:hypothetical protein
MNRLFSVVRRRPNYVDVLTPFAYGATGYRLKSSTNFDGSFTPFLTVTNVGYLDPSININTVDAQPLGGFTGQLSSGRNVRIVFNPATFSLTDTSDIWLQFAQVVGSTETLVGAPTLLLPDSSNHGVGIVTIHGQAPSGASTANSFQIDLPRLMEDFHIHNEDPSNSLYVSTEAGGPETKVPPDTAEQFTSLRGTQGSLWVRGGGGAVEFSARFTLAYPR